VSKLPDEEVRRMRMIPFRSISDAFGQAPQNVEGYIMPQGAAFLPQVLS
jgi:hypothetical protein